MRKPIDNIRLLDGSVYVRGEDFRCAMYDNVAGYTFINLDVGVSNIMIPVHQVAVIIHGSINTGAL